MFYDSGVYRLGDRKKSYVEIDSVNDVAVLNRMQIAHSNETVYFRSTSDAPFLIQESYKSFHFRRKGKNIIRSSRIEGEPDSEIIQLSPEEIKMDIRLSFLSIQKKAKKWLKELEKEQYQPVLIPRDYGIIAKEREYRELAKKHGHHPLGFAGYLAEN